MERRVLFIDDDRAGREVALFNLRKGGDKVGAAAGGNPSPREQLLLAGEKALERQRLSAEVRDLRIRATGVERDVVSVSPAMQRVLEMADRGARTEATRLITGESGTGKEAVARRIHVRSPRAEKAFVAVNCAALPAER